MISRSATYKIDIHFTFLRMKMFQIPHEHHWTRRLLRVELLDQSKEKSHPSFNFLSHFSFGLAFAIAAYWSLFLELEIRGLLYEAKPSMATLYLSPLALLFVHAGCACFLILRGAEATGWNRLFHGFMFYGIYFVTMSWWPVAWIMQQVGR
jgi:hypothetical protein